MNAMFVYVVYCSVYRTCTSNEFSITRSLLRLLSAAYTKSDTALLLVKYEVAPTDGS